jgi:hypothetical protein
MTWPGKGGGSGRQLEAIGLVYEPALASKVRNHNSTGWVTPWSVTRSGVRRASMSTCCGMRRSRPARFRERSFTIPTVRASDEWFRGVACRASTVIPSEVTQRFSAALAGC